MLRTMLHSSRSRLFHLAVAFLTLPSPAAAQSSLAQAPAWDLEEVLRMGAYDTPGLDLSLVTDLATDTEGRIVVLDRLGPTVRVFSNNGEFIKELGSRGEGPGEYRMPFRLGLLGDSVWITDGRLYRVTYFSRDLEVVGTLPARSSPSGSGLSAPASAVLRDGSLVFQEALGLTSMKVGKPAPVSIFVASPDGRVADTLVTFNYGKRFFPLEVRGTISAQENPFSPNGEWAASRKGTQVVVLRQELESQEITVHGSDNRRRTATFVERGPVLAKEDVERWASTVAEKNAMGRNGLAREYYQGLLDVVGFPKTAPVVDRILVENSGAVWLQLWGLPGGPGPREMPGSSGKKEWVILTPGLEPAGRITLPSRAVLLDVQCSGVLAAQYDELDVPFISRYEVHPPRPWCNTPPHRAPRAGGPNGPWQPW